MNRTTLLGAVVCLTAILAPVSSATAGLPRCTIDFDGPCPDDAAVCGASFIGGQSCLVEGLPACYDTGTLAFKVTPAASLMILFEDDVISLRVFFAGAGAGSTGRMRFLDADGREVDTPLETNGDCLAGMPARQTIVFTQAVRSIEVAAAGGPVWIDTFEINPLCGSAADCDDGDPCTTDACVGGDCVHTPIANCGDDSGGNDNENNNGSTSGDQGNENDAPPAPAGTGQENGSPMEQPDDCGADACAPGGGMSMPLVLIGSAAFRRRRKGLKRSVRR